ncbi:MULTISPECIES: GH39 family glycosyl hydrolase [unclassified Mycobacterium]|uniref:GH39 family glycosyl hydrolase n=1 Tax=unclassified Mycobacterium TaxID=2642494 RepID=UPI0029C849FE|nr:MULTISPECIES: hypothetical protein [unclassified Mycobacterium]
MIDYGINQIEMMLSDPGVTDYSKATTTRRIYQGIRDLGCRRIRIEAIWSYLETSKGIYNWTDLDRALILAHEYGLKPLLILGVHRPGASSLFGIFQTPGWVNATDFGNMARAVAQRYGPAGMGLVDEFEIWNEENQGQFWGAGDVDPTAYTEYLKTSATGIRQVHPDAGIIIGGFMPIGTLGKVALDPLPFLQGIYRAGGKDFFTAVGNHPYAIDYGFREEMPSATQTFQKVDDALRVEMVAQGDGDKFIQWTEIGFAAPLKMTETQRADWLARTVTLFNAKPHVERFYIYNFRDSGADTSNESFQFGIVTYGWAPKQPTYDYVAALRPDASVGAATGTGTARGAIGLAAKTTGSGSATATVRPGVALVAAATGSGEATGELLGRPIGSAEGTGTATATVVAGAARAAAATGSGTATAIASTIVERAGAATGSGTTTAVASQQKTYTYDPTAHSGVEPTSLFTPFGLGYDQPFGLLVNPTPSVNGYYYSGGIYVSPQLSANHYAEVTAGVGAGQQVSGDRSILPVIRSNADGTQWVSVASHWGGANSIQIITLIGGVVTIRASATATMIGDNDKLRIRADGNVYTASIFKVNTGVLTDVCTWTDDTGEFPGEDNLYTGFGWQHIRAYGNNYVAPAISFWRGSDLRPTVSMPQLFAVLGGVGAVLALVGTNKAAAAAGSGTATATVIPGTSTSGGATGSGSVTAQIGGSTVGSPSGDGTALGDLGEDSADRDAASSGAGAVTAAVGARTTPAAAGAGAVAAIIGAGLAAAAAAVGTAAATVAAGVTAAVAAAGSVAAAVAAGVTAAASGAGSVATALKIAATYVFTGSTKPTTLFTTFASSSFGGDYSVSSGVANISAGPSTGAGVFFTGGIYKTPMIGPTHYSEVQWQGDGSSTDRGNGVAVASNAAGSACVLATGRSWAGSTATQIFTLAGGTLTSRASGTTTWTTNDKMRIVVTESGGVYTYTVFKNGTTTGISWTDSGAAHTPGNYCGFALQGITSGGITYTPSGIKSTWYGGDN